MTTDSLPAGFDERVRALGLSLEAFAELVPCHLNTLWAWRTGAHRPKDAAGRVLAVLEDLERARLRELLERYPEEAAS